MTARNMILGMYDRKLVVAHTVRMVVSTPTRATLATWRSSSPHLTRKSSGRRTRMPLLLLRSPASTDGKLPVDALRLPGHRVLCRVRGLCGGTRYVDCSRCRAFVVISMCMHYAMLPTQARLAPHCTSVYSKFASHAVSSVRAFTSVRMDDMHDLCCAVCVPTLL